MHIKVFVQQKLLKTAFYLCRVKEKGNTGWCYQFMEPGTWVSHRVHPSHTIDLLYLCPSGRCFYNLSSTTSYCRDFTLSPVAFFGTPVSFSGKKLFLSLNEKHSYDFIPAFPFSLSMDVENRLFSFFCSSFFAYCDHAFLSVFISLMLEYMSIASSHLP